MVLPFWVADHPLQKSMSLRIETQMGLVRVGFLTTGKVKSESAIDQMKLVMNPE